MSVGRMEYSYTEIKTALAILHDAVTLIAVKGETIDNVEFLLSALSIANSVLGTWR